ncbi:MAG: hypothetical protein IJJ26_13885 [Victivallales bacterium]|nr:hypothetical protein [Victivallales bacterium]
MMKMRLLSIVFCVLAGFVMAEPWPGWKFDASLKDLGIFLYSAKGFGFTAEWSDTVKDPNGKPTLKLVMGEQGPDPKNWNRQFLCDSKLKTPMGSTVTVTFWAKASEETEVIVQLAQHEPPYDKLSKKASKSVKVGSEWQKITMTTQVELENVKQPVLPRLMLGMLPENTVIYVSQFDVTVTE